MIQSTLHESIVLDVQPESSLAHLMTHHVKQEIVEPAFVYDRIEWHISLVSTEEIVIDFFSIQRLVASVADEGASPWDRPLPRLNAGIPLFYSCISVYLSHLENAMGAAVAVFHAEMTIFCYCRGDCDREIEARRHNWRPKVDLAHSLVIFD